MSNLSYIREAMGYKERSTWLDLAVAAGVFVWYLSVIAGRIGDGPVSAVAFQGPMVRAVVISIVATIVLNIVAAILTGDHENNEDQRDRQIGRFGDWVGIFPLAAGAGTGLILAMVETDHFWIANAIYAGFVVSSLTSSVTRLIGYRRGVAAA